MAAAAASDTAAAVAAAAPTTLLAGLTGSIGMGKSTVSAMLVGHGVPVLSADEVVHQLYARGGAAVQPVGAAFPSAVVDGAVDRAALSKCVVGNEAAMQQLEALVHPLVEAERLRFVQQVTRPRPMRVHAHHVLCSECARCCLLCDAPVGSCRAQGCCACR